MFVHLAGVTFVFTISIYVFYLSSGATYLMVSGLFAICQQITVLVEDYLLLPWWPVPEVLIQLYRLLG